MDHRLINGNPWFINPWSINMGGTTLVAFVIIFWDTIIFKKMAWLIMGCHYPPLPYLHYCHPILIGRLCSHSIIDHFPLLPNYDFQKLFHTFWFAMLPWTIITHVSIIVINFPWGRWFFWGNWKIMFADWTPAREQCGLHCCRKPSLLCPMAAGGSSKPFYMIYTLLVFTLSI